MKKLLLSSCFLASGVVFAGATTVTTTMLTLPASNDALVKATLDSSSGWAQNIGTSSITTDIVATDYAILLNNSYTSGQWLWNVANVNFNDYTAGSEVAVVTEDDTVTGFSYHGRRAYGGEFVLTSVALSSFVGEGATFSSLDDFSISFSFSGQSSATFSIYLYSTDGSTATVTRLYSVTMGTTASISFVASTGYTEWSTLAGSLTGDETLIFVWNDNSAGSVNTVSSLTSSITIVTDTVPEPSAFGLLAGLGALALVAARRRRSRKQAA